jgi:hypothetical protein
MSELFLLSKAQMARISQYFPLACQNAPKRAPSILQIKPIEIAQEIVVRYGVTPSANRDPADFREYGNRSMRSATR